MNMYVNQQQLPYPTNAPIMQFIPQMNLRGFNPPMFNYEGPNWVLNNYAVIVQGTINVLQTKAGNPLRMFMYNLMCVNNYANADFERLIRNILDYIVFSVETGSIRDPNMAEQQAIPLMCTLGAAELTNRYPALMGYLDGMTQQAIMGNVSEYNRIMMTINQFKTSARLQNYNGNQNPMQQQYNQQMPYNGGFQQPQQVAQPVMNSFRGMSNPVAIGLGTNTGGSKYSDDSLSAKPVQYIEPVKPTEQPGVSNNPMAAMMANFDNASMGYEAPTVAEYVEDVDSKHTDHEWVPIKDLNKHYALSYNPTTHHLKYTIRDNEITNAYRTLRELPLMDHELHRIPTVFGEPLPNMRFTSDVWKFNTSVNNATLDLVELEKIEDEELKIIPYVDNRSITFNSLEAAWVALNLARFTVAKDYDTSVFRAHFIITDTIFGIKVDSIVLDKYLAATTFSDLQGVLSNSINDCSIEFWSECNDRLTKLINKLVKQEMGIPKLTIDSFATDYNDLAAVIKDTYGSVMLSAFTKREAEYIAITLEPVSDDSAAILNDDFLGMEFNCLEEADKPNVIYLTTEYYLVYIDITSYELDIDLAKDTSAVVDTDSNYVIYTMLKDLLADVEANNAEYSRILIKTKDNRILEATRGLLDHTCMLLTLVK